MGLPIDSIQIERRNSKNIDRVTVGFKTSDPKFAEQIKDFAYSMVMTPGFFSVDFRPTADGYEIVWITEPNVVKVSHLEPRV